MASVANFHPAPSSEPAQWVYGGFGVRLAAYLIDCVVVIIPVMAISSVLQLAFPIANNEDAIFVIANVLTGAAIVVGLWLYEALMTSSPRGATLGKRALGLRIVRGDGERLSFGRATGRYFLRLLVTPIVPLAIGFLLAAFTARKRALHDFMADTVVIEANVSDFQ